MREPRLGGDFQVSTTPTFDRRGLVSGSIHVARDITQRKKAEQLKDEFAGMVSHELKTPLTVIIGALAVAATDGISPEESSALIRDAASSADTLAGIVDNLLELSRFQSDRLDLNSEPVDIARLALGVTQKLQHKTSIHHISIDIPGDIPSVIIDRIRIERILNNLVENAIKYSPDGGEIRVSGARQDSQLVIGVSDQGIGISEADQLKLFQRFERLHMPDKQAIPGLGLGLRVCRILVEAHSGKIWVESAPGRGSTFFFTIPITRGKRNIRSASIKNLS